MSRRFHRWTGTVALATSLLVVPATAEAQADEEGPGSRVTTVTMFDVPIQHRSTVIPYMVQRVIPGSQLNPKVLNFRVLFHNWGGNASQVILVSEYADIADIEAECGQPCEDYFAAHPAPKEGEEGFEEYSKARTLYQELYSSHVDEIYAGPMGLAKVEGKLMGPVGGQSSGASEGDEGR